MYEFDRKPGNRNKLKINQNKDRGHLLEISTRHQVNHSIFLNVNKPLLGTLIEQFFFTVKGLSWKSWKCHNIFV